MTKRKPNACFFTASFFLTAVLLSGCATQWAPAYDQRIVDGLTNANIEAMTLFAALSKGARKSQFAQYRDRYNRLIGSVDALEMQIRSRPSPKMPDKLATVSSTVVETYLRSVAADQPEIKDNLLTALNKRAVNPSRQSVKSIQGMSRTIREMRDVHAAAGLTAKEIEDMRGIWAFYTYQALFYEGYLKR